MWGLVALPIALLVAYGVGASIERFVIDCLADESASDGQPDRLVGKVKSAPVHEEGMRHVG